MARILKKDIPTSEWLDRRRLRLTATDAAAILGLDPFKNTASLVKGKFGPAKKPFESLPMKVGHVLQDWLVEEAIVRHPELVSRTGGISELYVESDENREWAATVDFVQGSTIVEAKTVGLFGVHYDAEGEVVAKKSRLEYLNGWANTIPGYVFCQVQAQMLVMPEVARAIVVVLLGHETKVKTYVVPRDPDCIALLVAAGKQFFLTYAGGVNGEVF